MASVSKLLLAEKFPKEEEAPAEEDSLEEEGRGPVPPRLDRLPPPAPAEEGE